MDVVDRLRCLGQCLDGLCSQAPTDRDRELIERLRGLADEKYDLHVVASRDVLTIESVIQRHGWHAWDYLEARMAADFEFTREHHRRNWWVSEDVVYKRERAHFLAHLTLWDAGRGLKHELREFCDGFRLEFGLDC